MCRHPLPHIYCFNHVFLLPYTELFSLRHDIYKNITHFNCRPLLAANFSDNLLSLLLLHILSVPAFIHHVSVLADEVI